MFLPLPSSRTFIIVPEADNNMEKFGSADAKVRFMRAWKTSKQLSLSSIFIREFLKFVELEFFNQKLVTLLKECVPSVSFFLFIVKKILCQIDNIRIDLWILADKLLVLLGRSVHEFSNGGFHPCLLFELGGNFLNHFRGHLIRLKE